MTLLREPNSNVIAQYTTPVKGTWSSVAIHQVPPDALYTSSNVFIREGKLRNRPGLLMLNNTIFDAPIIGGAMAVTPVEKRLIALSKSTLYELGEFDTGWTVRTVGTYADTDTSVIDVAFIQSSGEYTGIIAQEKYALKKWTIAAGGGALVATLGTVPFAKSVCVAGRRVVALVSPHTVVWSDVFDYTKWHALAYNIVAQTNDVGVCVRTLSNLSFVLYKERSLYPARAQAGDDSTAFVFSEPLKVEGPAGIRAVVDMNNAHMYMTRNGRIAIFNGTQYPQWIADGVWLYLQGDIDPVYSHMIHGVYDYRLHCVFFFYVRRSSAGKQVGVVIVNLPLEGVDLQVQVQALPAIFPGVSAKGCSHSCEMRFNQSIDRSLVFTSAPGDNQSFIMDEETNTDDGVAYDCMMQTGLTAMPDAVHSEATIEVFTERGVGYGAVMVDPVVSDGLENKEGTLVEGKTQVIDLEVNPVVKYTGFNTPSRFFGLRYSWSSVDKVRYSGTVLYGRSLLQGGGAGVGRGR